MREVLIALVLLVPVLAFAQEPTATVTIHVVDKDGFTVEGCRVARFASVGREGADLTSHFRGLRGTQVPWGLYNYTLKRTLADGREGSDGGRIGISGREMFVVVQADTSLVSGFSADGTFSPNFVIKGKLDPMPAIKSEPVWIRLSPVHGSFQWDESVDSSGEFRIHHPLQGLYLLSVIEGDEVLHVQPIVFGRGFPPEGFVVKLPSMPPEIISPQKEKK
jgi:hypothetical protein